MFFFIVTYDLSVAGVMFDALRSQVSKPPS